ncbi:MAG: hypothetical protein G01um101425_528 [Candidatus Peregrinibacteria bacterium Gr01-1014_25]|nr:MAG: hypothetical protein G01um101425_528 [Candidatus Peregrinibacteria bacterium Gr01-1014_25]
MNEPISLGDLYERLYGLSAEAKRALENADVRTSKRIRRRIAEIQAVLDQMLTMAYEDPGGGPGVIAEGDEFRCFPDTDLAHGLGSDIERVHQRLAQQNYVRAEPSRN